MGLDFPQADRVSHLSLLCATCFYRFILRATCIFIQLNSSHSSQFWRDEKHLRGESQVEGDLSEVNRWRDDGKCTNDEVQTVKLSFDVH